MKINRKLRLQMLAQSWLFVLLFLALMVLIGYLASLYHVSKDITQANHNTLTQGSINVLKQMKGPINLMVFASKDDPNNGDTFRKGMTDFISRYQRTKPDIHLKFINFNEEPKLVRENGIKTDGEMVVEYEKKTEHITPPFAEQEMTNLLVRLARTHNQAVMYLDGHGERNLMGLKNNDLGEFGKQLEKKGFKFANPNLLVAQSVPSNGSMLVVAGPQVDVTEIEAKKIKAYLEAGGNLLWLLDDDNYHGMKMVADYLGLTVSPGIVVDTSSAAYGAEAKVSYASAYGDHAITKNFTLQTLFPDAHEVTAKGTEDNGWKVSNLIDVAPNGWLESEKIAPDAKDQKVSFDAKADKRGPINIGVAMEREYGKRGQRVVVVGNGNFLSNTFVTNVSNLDLGVNIINWLSGDDRLITIQPMPLKDINVTIPGDNKGRLLAWTVFHAFQYFIPIGIFIAGLLLWWKRKKA